LFFRKKYYFEFIRICRSKKSISQTKRKKEIDIIWSHYESVSPHRLLVKCKCCSHTCWGGVARMKHHLVGTKENVIACTSVPNDVRGMFLKLLEDKEKMKEANRVDCFEETNIQCIEKGKQGVTKQKTINEMFKDRELVIQDICNCIFGNALPFNLVRSSLFT